MRNPFLDIERPSIAMTDDEVMRSVMSHVIYDAKMGIHGYTARSLYKGKVTRDWLRRQLQATAPMYPEGNFGPRQIEDELDMAKLTGGYKEYWKRWRWRVLYDANACRWAERMLRIYGAEKADMVKAIIGAMKGEDL